MRKLGQLVEDAYDLFAPYVLGAGLSVCKACCVTDAEEQELLATPLRRVSRELLQNAYYESARNYSDQERWEMKHFLPRVLELVGGYEFPCHSLEITFSRLDLNLPRHWPPAERELLAAFALAYFRQSLGRYPLPQAIALSELLVMFGRAYFDLAPLLREWTATDTPASLAHFTDLLVDELRLTASGTGQLSNPFSEPRVNEPLAAWLSEPGVRAVWGSRLEGAVLRGGLPDEQATRASWAYEVVTKGLADVVMPPGPPPGPVGYP